MKLKAAIFDFDGVILDTEVAELAAWQAVFREHGATLAYEDWCVCIGTSGAFDPPGHLERAIGRPVDRAAVLARYRELDRGLLREMEVKPGVRERLREARELGVRTAIASSSLAEWVEGHLAERDLRGWFDAVVVRTDRLPAKPKPDLYLAALAQVGASAGEAVAFEDSMNGIAAAKAAGLYCVAIPNDATRALDLSAADERVESLADVRLASLGGRNGA